jgi:hypothetical protein
MTLTISTKFKELEVGKTLVIEHEDYAGQISRAAYNAGLTLRRVFVTRRFEGYIYVCRLF